MNATKRTIAAAILMSAALSVPTQAYAADTPAAPPMAPVGELPLLGGILGTLTGGLADPTGMVNTLLPNGVLGG